MPRLVLLRHGQSIWNKENRFTGWQDVDLSEKGISEALDAGKMLRQKGYRFDKMHTSFLMRAILTGDLVLKELGQLWIPVEKSWRLNERHYGGLTGLNKSETKEKYGEEQVHIWRRSYATPPPQLEKDNKENPSYEDKYWNLTEDEKPMGESLKMTLERVLPYWNNKIWPDLKKDKKLLVAAHGNSVRAILKHIAGISDEEITGLEIPTAVPVVVELDENFAFKEYYFLEN